MDYQKTVEKTVTSALASWSGAHDVLTQTCRGDCAACAVDMAPHSKSSGIRRAQGQQPTLTRSGDDTQAANDEICQAGHPQQWTQCFASLCPLTLPPASHQLSRSSSNEKTRRLEALEAAAGRVSAEQLVAGVAPVQHNEDWHSA